MSALLVVIVFVLTTSAKEVSGWKGITADQENNLVPSMPGTFLTGPNEGEPLTIALSFIRANRNALRMSEAEVSDLVVKTQYLSQKSGVTHIYLIQTHNGIEVYNAVLNINIGRDGSVINVGNRIVPELTGAIRETGVALSAVDAIEKAAQHLKLELN